MEIRIKICNWEKYNGRKDVANPSWFRFQQNFFDDLKIKNLDDDEKLFFIWLLCEASKGKNDMIFLDGVLHREVHRVFHRWSKKDVTAMVDKLLKLNVIEVRTLRGRYVDVTQTVATEQNKTRQDKTVQDLAAVAAPEISDSEKHNSRKKKSPASPPVIFYDEKLNPIASELAARNVRSQMTAQWLKNFSAEIILEEFWKAVDWAENSGKVKSFGAFFSNWLKRTAQNRENEIVIREGKSFTHLKGWEE